MKQASKIYDGGHQTVTNALHEAFDYALTRDVAQYKELSHPETRLAQTADSLGTIELANMRFDRGEESKTYQRLFGTRRKFRQNYLKSARRKVIE